jgi:hypothetical protein
MCNPHDIGKSHGLAFAARMRARGQGMLDEILTPQNVLEQLQSTKRDFDLVNLKAKGDPAWDLEYQSFQEFYSDNKNRTWTLSQATVEENRRRQARLADWQKKLAERGINTGPDVRVSSPEPLINQSGASLGFSLDSVQDLLKWGAIAGGVYLAAKALGKAPRAARPANE